MSLAFFYHKGFSQTQIEGRVEDSFGIPIDKVYVELKRSHKQVNTNDEGHFLIMLTRRPDTLKVSAPGYVEREIPTNVIDSSYITIRMEEHNQLSEIVVNKLRKRIKKKDNPAYRIMKEIWKHRKSNALDVESVYDYRKLTSVESGGIFAKNTLQKTRIIKKGKDSVSYMIGRHSGIDDTYKMPINLKETLTHYYVDKTIGKSKTTTEHNQESRAFETYDFFFERIENSFNEVDIYKNRLRILDNQFESPVSADGFAVYSYTLRDSTEVDGHKQYKISFYPLNEMSLAFRGEFLVQTPSYTVVDVKMTTLKNLNLNLVKSITVRSQFSVKSDSMYLPKKTIVDVRYGATRSDKTFNFYSKKIDTYTDYRFGEQKPASFYSKKEETSQEAYRPDEILDSASTASRDRVMNAIKGSQDSKKLQAGYILLNTLSTGYIRASKTLQLGNVLGFYNYNPIEGDKYILAGRTFKTLNDRFRTYFYYAYSSKIARSNVGLYPSYLINNNIQTRLGVFYINDLRESLDYLLDGSLQNFSFPSSIVNLKSTSFVSKVQNMGINSQFAFSQNFRLGVSLYSLNVVSSNAQVFKTAYFDGKKNVSDFHLTPIFLSLAYSPKRNVLGTGVEQGVGGARYAALSASYVTNLGFLGGNVPYQRLSLQYSAPFRLGRFGVLSAQIGITKLFSTLPVPLLLQASSNTSIFSLSTDFALINRYDYVMDTSYRANFTHQFNGYILNKIPLVNKLRLRSLVFFNIIYGTISKENINANRSSVIYNTPKPYYEYGFGIENIGIATVRFLRVDFIWRGDLSQNFVKNSSNVNMNFGMRFSVNFDSF